MVNYSKSSLLKELGDTQALIQQREQNVIDKTNRIADLKLMILETQDDVKLFDGVIFCCKGIRNISFSIINYT